MTKDKRHPTLSDKQNRIFEEILHEDHDLMVALSEGYATDQDKELEEFLNSEEFLEIAGFHDPEEDAVDELLSKIGKLHDGNVLMLASRLQEMCFNLMVKFNIDYIKKHHNIHHIISFQGWLDFERGKVALTKAHPDERKYKVETYIDLNNKEVWNDNN